MVTSVVVVVAAVVVVVAAVVVTALRKTRRDIMEMSDPILALNKNSFIRMRHKLRVSILIR